MLLCALGSLITSVVVGFFAAQVAANLSRRLRREIFEKVESFSMEEISGFSTDSLITRSTNDITQIEMIVAMGLQLIVKAPIMAVMAILKIQDKGTWQWSALTACAVVLLVTTILIIMFIQFQSSSGFKADRQSQPRVERKSHRPARCPRIQCRDVSGRKI